MPNITDHRSLEDQTTVHNWGVVTDKCMSGWGLAPRKSFYAVPIYGGYGGVEAKLFMVYSKNRKDFVRPRINRIQKYPTRLRKGDHLTIDYFPWSFLDQHGLIKPNVDKNEISRLLENGWWLSDKTRKILQNLYK